MILLSCLVSCVVAHNWVNSPARSQFASTVNPTIPSQTGEPHAQVIAGQDFQIEWVVGHDGDAYFVLLKNDANAMKNMLMHRTTNLEDYLNNAPVGQVNVSAATTRWGKHHRKYNSYTLNADNAVNDSYFRSCLRSTDAGYLPRPVAFQGSFSGAPSYAQRNQTLIADCLYKFPQPGVDSDRRVQYSNAKYPWIIAVHKYRYFANTPGRGDFALFQFPAGTPPGDYIVHWGWRGYYDVIDVEVVAGSTPVALPYGTAPQPRVVGAPSKYRRIDHCAFIGALPNGNCVKMISDASSCMAQCDKQTDFACNGIQVFPPVMPPWVYKNMRNVSFIIDGPTCSRTTLSRNGKFTEQICQPLQQRAKNTAIPEDSYQTSTDPEDPIFYSTCLFRVKPSTLATPPPPPPPREALWRFRDQCVDCAIAQRSTYDYFLPVWNITACKNCDVDGPKLVDVPAPPNYELKPMWNNSVNGSCRAATGDAMKTDYTCVNTTTCDFTLRPPGGPGNTDVSERDCYELARKDTRCSRFAYRRMNIDLPYECHCWAKTPCCGACVVARSGSMRLYELPQDPPY